MIAGLHLGGWARGGIYPPENRMAPLGYVVCIVTYNRFDTDSNSLDMFTMYT